MIAFEIFGWPIYRYGIFYLITFLTWYMLLMWLWKRKYFVDFPGVQKLLTDKIDDLMMVGLIWVMLWGRLWHVFLYEWWYYSQHLSEILQVWQWWMSFVWGFIWVTLGLLYLTWKMKLTKQEIFLLGDIILCIVPVGILLGRIGNFLNQELWWRPIYELSPSMTESLRMLWLTYVYESVDTLERVNTNLIQSGAEWLFLGICSRTVLFGQYIRNHIRPGLITGIFLMWYGIVRFFVEFLKELPAHEWRGILSVTQWVMIVFIVCGVRITDKRQKEYISSRRWW